MKIPEKMREVLKHEGVAAIATNGPEGAHLIASWNSYLVITPDERLLVPAGGMIKTQQNLASDPRILMTFGTRGVQGLHGDSAGFLLEGKGVVTESGADYDALKATYPWLRACIAITIDQVTQTN